MTSRGGTTRGTNSTGKKKNRSLVDGAPPRGEEKICPWVLRNLEFTASQKSTHRDKTAGDSVLKESSKRSREACDTGS